jgi:hypothetical protein
MMSTWHHGVVIMELHSSWNELFWHSYNWIAIGCIVYMVNCNFGTHATCLLAFRTYKYNKLQVFNTIQKSSCKASCKILFFSKQIFILIIGVIVKSTLIKLDTLTWVSINYFGHKISKIPNILSFRTKMGLYI